MPRITVLFSCALLLCLPMTATAQNEVLNELYGNGVHAYFSSDYAKAHEHLTAAVDGGSSDPRVLYFRALCYLKTGREALAQDDLAAASKIEMEAGNLSERVNRALTRVQGTGRLKVESHRSEARLAVFQQRAKATKKRFDSGGAASDPAFPVAPVERPAAEPDLFDPPADPAPTDPAPAKPADPFAEPAPAKPADPAPAKPVDPFADPAAEPAPAKAEPADPSADPAAEPAPAKPADPAPAKADPDDPFADPAAEPAPAKPAEPAVDPAPAKPADPFADPPAEGGAKPAAAGAAKPPSDNATIGIGRALGDAILGGAKEAGNADTDGKGDVQVIEPESKPADPFGDDPVNEPAPAPVADPFGDDDAAPADDAGAEEDPFGDDNS